MEWEENLDSNNKKYITLAFIGFGALAGYIASVFIDTLARSIPFVAQFAGNDVIVHGVPLAVGLITFFVLQFNSKTMAWADEVVVEVLKVVWPSRRDTVAMTIVVTIMLILSGIILGAFDYISHLLVSYILG